MRPVPASGKSALLRLSLVVSFLMIVLSLFLLSACEEENSVERAIVNCEIDKGPCVKTVEDLGISATLDVTPKPVRPMTKLAFRMDLEQKGPAAGGEILLDISMPGMYMARNRVVLVHKGKGRYEGEGVIVRCPSGRRVWRADALLQGAASGGDKGPKVTYIFEVGK